MLFDYKARNKKQWETKRKNGTDIPWNKGLTKSDPRVAKYTKGHGDKLKGRKHTKEHNKKISEANKGRVHSPETRRKIANSKRGDKSHFWRGGLTEINKTIRHSLEYRLWREAVYRRDNWTCVWCKKVGGELNADHIKPFSLFPELRLAIDNGRTLCHACHKTTDTYGRTYSKRERDEFGRFIA